MTVEPVPVHDAYRSCEDDCTHDLAFGVLKSDLRDGDGPETPRWVLPIIGVTPAGAATWIREWREANE